MCRWVAYAGPQIYLQELLFDQTHSLVQQSLAAREASVTTNGDGFGVAWYGHRPHPGLFKDILPAWNDANLRSLSAQIQSGLFLAHVRASTGTSVSRNNCHPFVHAHWSFMHNGQIGGWQECRREVEALIDASLYRHRLGTTDSEALFLIALGEGLAQDPVMAMQRTLCKVLQVMARHQVREPLRLSAALSDGERIWAFRYSSDQRSPSLYFGSPALPGATTPEGMVTTIASEPSDNQAAHWQSVAEGGGLVWERGRVRAFALGSLPA